MWMKITKYNKIKILKSSALKLSLSAKVKGERTAVLMLQMLWLLWLRLAVKRHRLSHCLVWIHRPEAKHSQTGERCVCVPLSERHYYTPRKISSQTLWLFCHVRNTQNSLTIKICQCLLSTLRLQPLEANTVHIPNIYCNIYASICLASSILSPSYIKDYFFTLKDSWWQRMIYIYIMQWDGFVIMGSTVSSYLQ